MFTLLFRFQHFVLKTPLGKPIRGNYSLLWKCQWPFNAPHQGTPARHVFDCFDYACVPR